MKEFVRNKAVIGALKGEDYLTLAAFMLLTVLFCSRIPLICDDYAIPLAFSVAA